MEAPITNRVSSHSMLTTQPSIAASSPFTGLQQSQDKLPPTYEEAHLAVQSLDGEKLAIYRHPLFPLLAMLLEKCELATQTSECPTSAAFDNDIKNYIIQHNRDGKPFFTDDQELDNLIVKAIQVFRIHLLELEKVNELCKDFCQRYIACLKGKMQSDNLLRSPLTTSFPTPVVGGMSQTFQQLPTSPPQQLFLQQQAQQTQQMAEQQISYYTTPTVAPCSVAMATPPSGSVINQPVQQQVASTAYMQHQQQPQPIMSTSTPTPSSIVSQAGQSFVLTQIPSTQTQYSVCSTTSNANVTTSPTTPTSSMSAGSPLEIAVPVPIPLPSLDLDSPTETPEKKKAKRGVLPKQATNIMKQWLFSHLMHPYPTEDEKRAIAAQTDLTILQVNNWFINARRRILQPMLDAGNPDSHKAKKSKIQSRPAQRFWPDSLVPTQYSAIPIAPNLLAGQQGIPNTVQVQTLPSGSISVPTLVNSAGAIPGTVQLPHNIMLQQGSSIVIVTLPPNASTIYTVSSASSTQSVQPTISSSTVTSHSETTSAENLVPILTSIQQGSPTLHGSPLPTMVHNGNVMRGEYQLMGSPNQMTSTSTVSSGDTIVQALAMEGTEVSSGVVN